MKESDFQKLVLGVKQMGAIMRGERIKHRRTTIRRPNVVALRNRMKLSQAEFARMIGITVSTLQSWEEGRREPTGPARALLRVVEKQPAAVLAALTA